MDQKGVAMKKMPRGKKKAYIYGVVGGIMITLIYVFCGGTFALRTENQKAYAAFKRGDFRAAADVFTDPMWRGVSFYRAGDFESAAQVFSGLQTGDGFYNHGNSLVMLGKYAAAIEAYDKALALGEHPDALTNRAIAEEQMKSLQFDGGNMTDGKIGSDGISFEPGKGGENAGEEVVQGADLNEAQMREVWLRKVQTKPADFLKVKFMYQNSQQEGEQGED